MKNFHLPLPEQTYMQLQAETEQARKARHDAIVAYAEEMAGSSVDLDSDMEAAGIELLLKPSTNPPKSRK